MPDYPVNLADAVVADCRPCNGTGKKSYGDHIGNCGFCNGTGKGYNDSSSLVNTVDRFNVRILYIMQKLGMDINSPEWDTWVDG